MRISDKEVLNFTFLYCSSYITASTVWSIGVFYLIDISTWKTHSSLHFFQISIDEIFDNIIK